MQRSVDFYEVDFQKVELLECLRPHGRCSETFNLPVKFREAERNVTQSRTPVPPQILIPNA